MVLRQRQVEFPFQLGLAQDLNPAIAPQGVFKQLDNVYFDKTGRLVRRYGYENLLPRPEPATYDGGAFRLAQWETTRIRLDDSSSRSDQTHGGNGRIYVNSTQVSSGGWLDAFSLALTSEIQTTPLANVQYAITDTGGIASVNGYLLFATVDAVFIRVYIRDTEGRVIFCTSYGVAGAKQVRVFRWGDRLACGYISTSNVLTITWWDTTTPLAGTVMTVANVDYQYGWDCAWLTGDVELSVVCRLTGGTVAQLLSLAAGSGAVVPSASVSSGISNAVDMAIIRWSTRVIIAVATTADTYALGADAGTFANPSTAIQVSTSILENLLIAPYVDSVASDYHVLGSIDTTVASSPGTGMVYQQVQSLRFTDAPGGGSSAAGTAPFQGVVPLSKAFAIEGDRSALYFWAYYDSAPYGSEWTDADLVWDGTPTGQQRQIILIHASSGGFQIAGRTMYRSAYGEQDLARTLDVAQYGDTNQTWYFLAPEVNSGDVRVRGDSSATLIELRLADPTRVAAMVSGDTLVIPAGAVRQYTQTGLTDVGFIHGPDQVKCLQTAAGSTPAAGDYLYRVVFEFVDGSNRVTRSPPSLALPFTVTVAHTIDVSWQCPISNFGADAVVAKVYRTKADGTLFYLAGSTVTTTAKFAFYDWLADTKADADLGPEILYTDSGDAPELAPLTTSVVISHGRRFWGFNGRQLFYSKWERTGFAPRFVETWVLTMPGEITALASQDDLLVVFGEDAIWTVGGPGPDDLGVGEFDPPVRLPGNVGCPRSLGGQRSVCTFELGTLFRSQKGLAILPRGLGEPQLISDPVEDSLGTAAVMAATNMPAEQMVKICLSDSILVWDYASGIPGIWTTESGSKHANIVDAILWDGVYTFAATSGSTTGYTWQEGSDYPDDAAGTPTPVTVTIETPELRPFGISGDGRVYAAVLEGKAAAGDEVASPWPLANYALVQATWTAGQPDPDGTNNARHLNGNTAVAEHYAYRDLSAYFTDDLPCAVRMYLKGDAGYCWIGVGDGATNRKEVRINLETKASVKAEGADDFSYRLTYVGDDWWLCEMTAFWSSTDRYQTVYVAPTPTKASGGVTSRVTIYYPSAEGIVVQQQLAIETSTDGATWPATYLRMYDVAANAGPWQYANPVQLVTGVRYRITDTIWNASSGARVNYNALGLFVADRDRRRPAGGARA